MSTNVQALDVAQGRDALNDRVESARRKTKIAAILITSDESLWPQIGKFVTSQFLLKQADSIEHMLKDTEAGSAAVLIWDARGEDNRLQRITELQQHSNRVAVLALDAAANSSSWDPLIRTNQIVALVRMPMSEGEFVKSLNTAGDEVLAKSALLGEPQASGAPGSKAADAGVPSGPSTRIGIIGGVVAAIAALAAALMMHRGNFSPSRPLPAVGVAPVAAGDAGRNGDLSAANEAKLTPGSHSNVSDQVEDLLEKAGQAMLDRRYIAPADNNALYFYKRVFNFDAQNGEARQGLERLAELLLSRAQSALDARQFDQALQALETARSLKPGDARMRTLDVRLANMRSELGTTQIQAALNAQNFERAASLIDEAARLHSIGLAQTAQLRDALKHDRENFEVNRLVKLAQARLQQDRLTEPSSDSAAFYLDRARHAGASEHSLAELGAALLHRVIESANGAIDQHRFVDAERWIAEARAEGAGSASLTALQHSLANARSQENRDSPDASRASDAAHSALAADTPAIPPPAEPARETALVLTKPIRPEYPQAAALNGLEGWVELSFTVNADGRVINARVSKANPAGVFDSAALRALQAARYEPLSKTDPSVSRQAKLKLAFRLSQ